MQNTNFHKLGRARIFRCSLLRSLWEWMRVVYMKILPLQLGIEYSRPLSNALFSQDSCKLWFLKLTLIVFMKNHRLLLLRFSFSIQSWAIKGISDALFPFLPLLFILPLTAKCSLPLRLHGNFNWKSPIISCQIKLMLFIIGCLAFIFVLDHQFFFPWHLTLSAS